MRFIAVIFICLLTLTPARAGQRYSSWPNPDASASKPHKGIQTFINRLNSLVKEAEKAHAADPRFLKDIHDLTREYSITPTSGITNNLWNKPVLLDEFADGNFTQNPLWTVSSGRFWVEKDWGLRSAVNNPSTQSSNTSQQQKKVKGRDRAIAIFGAVLNQALGQQGGQQNETASLTKTPENFASIYSTAAISNAFSINIEFSSWLNKGRLIFGPYKGAGHADGYRLAYTPGGSMELLRTSRQGTNVIDRISGPLHLEDNKTHTIKWTRMSNGAMSVSIDGQKRLNTTDNHSNGGFYGFIMVNDGGDFILKSISVMSTY